jgi:hypothetical protein
VRQRSRDGEVCDPEHCASIYTAGGQVVTYAVRSSVRPATRGVRVVSRGSGRVMAGRIVVSRRASLDLPAPRGPRSRRLWSERPHMLQLPP